MIAEKCKELKRLEEIKGAADCEETKKFEELKKLKVRRKCKKGKVRKEVRELKEVEKLEKQYGPGRTNADVSKMIDEKRKVLGELDMLAHLEEKYGLGCSDTAVSNAMNLIYEDLALAVAREAEKDKRFRDHPMPEQGHGGHDAVKRVLEAFNRRARKTDEELLQARTGAVRESAELARVQSDILEWEQWQPRLAKQFGKGSVERTIIDELKRNALGEDVREAINLALLVKEEDPGRLLTAVEVSIHDSESPEPKSERIWLALHRLHECYSRLMRNHWKLVRERNE